MGDKATKQGGCFPCCWPFRRRPQQDPPRAKTPPPQPSKQRPSCCCLPCIRPRAAPAPAPAPLGAPAPLPGTAKQPPPRACCCLPLRRKAPAPAKPQPHPAPAKRTTPGCLGTCIPCLRGAPEAPAPVFTPAPKAKRCCCLRMVCRLCRRRPRPPKPNRNPRIRVAAPTPQQSEVLGISVAYLASKFRKEVSAVFGDEDPNYYEVNKKMLYSEIAKGRFIKCPRDGREGCSYVDAVNLLEPGHTQPATLMLSWSWHYTVETVVGALSRWCRINGKDPRKVFVWQCALCNNQFRVEESKAKGEWESFETFKDMFEKRMDHTSHILSLMAPWDCPVNTTRIWCVFEKHMAVVKNHKFDVILPEEEDAKFQHALETSGMQPIWELFSKVDIQSAQATSEIDRQNILHLVDPEVDVQDPKAYSKKCSKLNAEVVSRLQSMFAMLAVDNINKRVAKKKHVPLPAFAHAAWLLESLRADKQNIEYAKQLYAKGMAQSEKEGTTNTFDHARLLMKYAAHLSRNGMVEGQILGKQYLAQADALFQKLNATVTAEYGELLKDRANALAVAGDYDGQLETMLESRRVLIEAGARHTRAYPNVIKSLARYYGYRKYPRHEVHALFDEARDCWIAIGGEYSVGYGMLLKEMAVFVSGEDTNRAKELFQEAQRVYIAAGCNQTSDYIALLKSIGNFHWEAKDYPEAKRYQLKAKHSAEKLHFTHSMQHGVLLKELARTLATLGEKEEATQVLAESSQILDRLLEERKDAPPADRGAIFRHLQKTKSLQLQVQADDLAVHKQPRQNRSSRGKGRKQEGGAEGSNPQGRRPW
mmetsp:Transcript_5493/g.11845  ORF Transcript_5493/g.11845 Transcript_5493/m.11845 type:complete len:817 (+) Transcript_5493:19-2469(+)